VLIVLSGLPGTGKSLIATEIARVRRAVIVSVDPIESAVISAGISQSFETGLAAYLVADAVADQALAIRLDVVVDAVNSVEPARDMWRNMAARHNAAMAVIECVVSDEALHRARLAARNRGLALREPTWDDVRQRRLEWTPWREQALRLDALASAETNVARALDYVETVATRAVSPPVGGGV
jgi:predicted kinase